MTTPRSPSSSRAPSAASRSPRGPRSAVQDPPRVDAVVATRIQDLQQQLGSDLIGVFLSGSVARGEAHRHSDVDLIAVHLGGLLQRQVGMIDDIEVDTWIVPDGELERRVESEASEVVVDLWAHAQVVGPQPGGTNAEAGVRLEHLIERARQQLAAPRAPWAPSRISRLRYELTHLLKDALDVAESDAETCAMLVHHTLHRLLEVSFALRRAHCPPPKRRLPAIRQQLPDLEPRIRRILSEQSPLRSRCFWLAELIREVLAPVGGLLGTWESEPRIIER